MSEAPEACAYCGKPRGEILIPVAAVTPTNDLLWPIRMTRVAHERRRREPYFPSGAGNGSKRRDICGPCFNKHPIVIDTAEDRAKLREIRKAERTLRELRALANVSRGAQRKAKKHGEASR